MVPLYVGHHALHVHLTSEQGPLTRVESQVPHDVLDSWHSACSHYNKAEFTGDKRFLSLLMRLQIKSYLFSMIKKGL